MSSTSRAWGMTKINSLSLPLRFGGGLNDPKVRIIKNNEDLSLCDTGHIPGAVHVDCRSRRLTQAENAQYWAFRSITMIDGCSIARTKQLRLNARTQIQAPNRKP